MYATYFSVVPSVMCFYIRFVSSCVLFIHIKYIQVTLLPRGFRTFRQFHWLRNDLVMSSPPCALVEMKIQQRGSWRRKLFRAKWFYESLICHLVNGGDDLHMFTYWNVAMENRSVDSKEEREREREILENKFIHKLFSRCLCQSLITMKAA